MADDPTRDVLVDALRRFRRASGDLGRERVAADDTLQEWVGEGDLDQTWNIIMRLVEQSASDPAGDVFAFFASSGWQTSGDTLDTRLKKYAAKFHVDERTALRRSDRGAKKLAKMLRDALTYDRPLAQFFVFQDGPVLIPWLTIHVQEDSAWRRPRVYVNDQRVENLAFDVKGPGSFAGYLEAQERIADVPLDPTVGGYEPMASVRVQWAMPIWPSWDLSTHLADNRLVARLTVEKDGVAEVRVSWFGDDAAATRDTPFAPAPVYTKPV
ncbi:hypothetical protein [Kribbella sp. NPDC051718]|uniref:hypothetical protein n=1 Tax=Kribbella sp. NPDC051718 TaxID=3155168 RepID=UPI003417A188